VEQEGPACHTNRRSCFYTAVRAGEEVVLMEPVHGGQS
jgi:phosphoribosyl-AMP cyclohydrolase